MDFGASEPITHDFRGHNGCRCSRYWHLAGRCAVQPREAGGGAGKRAGR